MLLTGAAPLMLLAAETAGPRGLAELAALAAEAPVLLVAPMRAAALLRRPGLPVKITMMIGARSRSGT